MLKTEDCVSCHVFIPGAIHRALSLNAQSILTLPDDAAPILRPLQGVGIKFSRELSGVFGSR